MGLKKSAPSTKVRSLLCDIFWGLLLLFEQEYLGGEVVGIAV